jgi:hypothetical protein
MLANGVSFALVENSSASVLSHIQGMRSYDSSALNDC